MGAFADTIGVTVGMKTGFKVGFDDVAEGVMAHPIAEGGGADFTPFGFVDFEVMVSAGLVAALYEVGLQSQ